MTSDLSRATFTVVANLPDGAKITVEVPQASRTASSLRELISAIELGHAPGEWVVLRTETSMTFEGETEVTIGPAPAPDPFQELAEIIFRLQRLTEHSDGVVSIHINSSAWKTFEAKVKNSPSAGFVMHTGTGSDGRGRRFEMRGVEVCDYDRVTGRGVQR